MKEAGLEAKQIGLAEGRIAIGARHRKGVSRILSSARLAIANHLLAKGERRRAMALLYDPGCLRFPRFWLRLFVAAHLPSSFAKQWIT